MKTANLKRTLEQNKGLIVTWIQASFGHELSQVSDNFISFKVNVDEVRFFYTFKTGADFISYNNGFLSFMIMNWKMEEFIENNILN